MPPPRRQQPYIITTHAPFFQQGFYGMNLSNGACGPEGCSVLGTQDFGHSQFLTVVGASVACSMTACAFFFFYTMRVIDHGV